MINTDEDAQGGTETREKKGAGLEGQNMVCFVKIMNSIEGQLKMTVMSRVGKDRLGV